MSEEGGQSRHREGDVVQQYYIAVDRLEFKMGTLVELLSVLGRRDGLPLVICCSSRDSLVEVCATLVGCGQFVLSMLHSDVDKSERATSLETFRLAMSEWNYFNIQRPSVEKQEAELRPGKSLVLVMTDVCLPSHALGETPLPARIMINFDIPTKKESHYRRIAACIGSPLAPLSSGRVKDSGGGPSSFVGRKMVITMVVGYEVTALSSLEESCGIVIDEMPINISELI